VKLFTSTGFCTGLDELSCAARLKLEAGSEREWERIRITDRDDVDVAVVVRHKPADAFVRDCIESLRDQLPVVTREWLLEQLAQVKAVYEFQPLEGARSDHGWEELDNVYHYLWLEHGGFFWTADGVTDLWGFTIVLPPLPRALGHRWMAFPGGRREGIYFRMNLEDARQRREFLLGQVPEEAEIGTIGAHPRLDWLQASCFLK
jgi:hypothetical protein